MTSTRRPTRRTSPSPWAPGRGGADAAPSGHTLSARSLIIAVMVFAVACVTWWSGRPSLDAWMRGRVDATTISLVSALLLTAIFAARRRVRDPVNLIPTFVVAFELVPMAFMIVGATLPGEIPHFTEVEHRRLIIVAGFAGLMVLFRHLQHRDRPAEDNA